MGTKGDSIHLWEPSSTMSAERMRDPRSKALTEGSKLSNPRHRSRGPAEFNFPTSDNKGKVSGIACSPEEWWPSRDHEPGRPSHREAWNLTILWKTPYHPTRCFELDVGRLLNLWH